MQKNLYVTLNPPIPDERTTTSIGIIHYSLKYLAMGSIATTLKDYVDRVYIIYDGQDKRIPKLARSLGVDLVDMDKGDYSLELDRIRLENDGSTFIMIYGDGTHNPDNIPVLMSYLDNGYDIVVGFEPLGYSQQINDSVFFLNKTKPRRTGSGIIACSSRCMNSLDLNMIKARDHTDITRQILAHGNKNSLRIKYHYFSEARDYDVFGLYRIGVVVPAYNEELLIEETINGIPGYVSRIYLIDDGSTDRTPEIVRTFTDPRIVLVRHEKNKGVGAAIIHGYRLALEDNMDMVAVMAGDNQMDPGQLPRLLMPIIEGRADYTKGNRLISRDFTRGMSRWRLIGNTLLTLITKIGSGYWHISDPQNGYTVISRQALEVLNLDSIYTYYGYCNDLLVKLNTYGFRALDVPMPSRYGGEKSKIRYGRYIVKVAPMLFRGFLWRLKTKYVVLGFNPLVLFYGAGMVLLPSGLLLCLFVIAEWILGSPVSSGVSLFAALITLTGFELLLFAMVFDMYSDCNGSRS